MSVTKRSSFMSKTARGISVALLLAIVVCSTLTVACEAGIETDKSKYKTTTDVQLSYNTPDITNGSHEIKIYLKDGAPVYSSDELGNSSNGSITWSGDKAEGEYIAKLFVNGSLYDKCTFTVCNDDIAPITTYQFSKTQKSDGSYDTGVKLSFTATDNEGGSGVSAIYYWGIQGENHITYSSPIAFSNPGTYTVTFKAMDKAGNLETVDGKYRMLRFTVTAPAPSPTPTPTPTATPVATPSLSPTIEPTVSPVPVTQTAHDVSDPMAGAEAVFTAESALDTRAKNSPGGIVAVGSIAGIAVIAGAALLVFRRL